MLQDGATCQHGLAECGLNRILSCALHLHPKQNSWFPFAKCVESRALGNKQPIGVAAPCANETGLNFQAIQQCAEGDVSIASVLAVLLAAPADKHSASH